MKYYRIDGSLRAQKRREWNEPVLGPITLVVVVLLASLIPAVVVYRRRERSAGIANSGVQPLVPSPTHRE
jgi:hypothetical protein